MCVFGPATEDTVEPVVLGCALVVLRASTLAGVTSDGGGGGDASDDDVYGGGGDASVDAYG